MIDPENLFWGEDLGEKTFAIYNLGCRTNHAELLHIAGLLEDLGFSPSSKPSLVLVNTCAVTQKAVSESKRVVKGLKRKFPKAKVVVLGCGVEYFPAFFSFADRILDNNKKEKLLSRPSFYSRGIDHPFPKSGRFFLRIQSGCNQFCSFCIVPYLRRKIVALSPLKVVSLIKKAQEEGYQEVVLVGTNLGLYQKKKGFSISDLLEEILEKTRIPRIAFGSINLEAFDKKFIRILSEDWKDGRKGRINRFFHIPLQSGSNRILKMMNRHYSLEEFSEVVNSLYNAAPFVSIGTDIIVGFPGENKEDFQQTFEAVASLPFSRLHVFRYNPRKGTVASRMEKRWGGVDYKERKERAKIIRSIGKKKRSEFFQRMKGKRFPVLFLGRSEEGWYGLTDNYFLVNTDLEEDLQGKIKEIVIS